MELQHDAGELVRVWAARLLPGWDVSLGFNTGRELKRMMRPWDGGKGTYAAMNYANHSERNMLILIRSDMDWTDPRCTLELTIIHELLHPTFEALELKNKPSATRAFENTIDTVAVLLRNVARGK